MLDSNAANLGINPQRIIVGGDSSGANLAAAAALRARDTHGPRIAHQLLCYPPLDASMSFPSFSEFGHGYFLTQAAMTFCWRAYLESAVDGESPYASPMRARDLTGLPPATLIVCEYDPLRDEGEAYARRLSQAGVTVECHRLEGMIHACIHMFGIAPRARKLLELARDSIAR